MVRSSIIFFLCITTVSVLLVVFPSGCAQIGMPTGGPRDTIPPKLVRSSPPINSTNFTGNKITLTFDEYVNVQDVGNNVIVSPLQKINPQVDYKLRTVTVKLKDTLLPNTTYSINFGDAIADNNENNPLHNFTYVFSTGNTIDSLELSGKVLVAESGRADSSLIVLLYRNTEDSAVQKTRPNYVAKLNGSGNFRLKNLSPGTYKIYALKDGDGSKTYSSRSELFAFADKPVIISEKNEPVTLYASAEEKDNKSAIGAALGNAFTRDRKLRYTTSLEGSEQELTDPFRFTFNRPLKDWNVQDLIVLDSSNNRLIPVRSEMDSTKKKLDVVLTWKEGMKYKMIVDKKIFTDTSRNNLPKSDTIKFTTKKASDYGNVVLRFTNIELAKHPLIEFVIGDEVKYSFPLTTAEWSRGLIKAGEYEMRIVYDENQNGKWDPGKYSIKRQPEKVLALPQKLNVKENWDNEQDIRL